jgi:hypothetical protein
MSDIHKQIEEGFEKFKKENQGQYFGISMMEEIRHFNIFKAASRPLLEKIRELENKLKDINMIMLTDTEKQLNEANEVIGFYADPKAWLCCCVDFATIQDNDVEWSKNTVENPKDHYEGIDRIGGKRAREYQSKYAKKSEG